MLRTSLLAYAIAITCGVTRETGAYTAPASAKIGDFLIQRAIQQQLYYSAQLHNEPMVGWLKKFKDHQHLDSQMRREGNCGMPGTYSATLDQLRVTPFPAYLSALGTEPNSSIEVTWIRPQRQLSARERANPYLNNQKQVVEVYDQEVVTKNILTQVLDTASALVETWVFHFDQAAKKDAERVANDRASVHGLPTTEMMDFAQLVKGGETAYAFFTGDEPMPLYDFDCRACDRFNTLRALSMLFDEVEALTPETAFETDYLRSDASAANNADNNEDNDVSDLIKERRRKRRERFEYSFVQGDDVTRARSARDAALVFLRGFCDTWVPKLVKGDSRSALGKDQFRHAPGMKENRPADAGVDAELVLEALWEYQDEAAYEITGGGELVLPRQLGERLRELRVYVALESKKTVLEMVKPELRQARLDYTDYVETEDDGLGAFERFRAAGDNDDERDAYSHRAIIAEMGL